MTSIMTSHALNETFRETEIGSLPMKWDVVSLSSVYSIQQGKAISRRHEDKSAPRFPFLRTSNVYWGRIELSALDDMPFTETEQEKLRLQNGDLLICEGGDIGRTAVWNGEIANCFYQNHLYRVRATHGNVEPVFHMYWMQAALTQLGLYAGAGNKTTIPNLSRSRLSSFLVPLPPLPEQRRIAAVLNAIQDAIAAQEDVIAAARQFKRSLMQRLFTYGPGREPAETKETEIGEIPAHWGIVTLGDIAKIGNGSTPKRTNPAYWDNGTIPWLTSTKIHDLFVDQADEYVTKLALRECHLPIVPRNSVLVAITGQGKTLGNAALTYIDTAINQHLAYVTVNRDGLEPEFILRYLNYRYEDLREAGRAGGSTKAALTCAMLRDYPAPSPSESEQRAVIGNLAAIDAKIAAEEDRKTALEALFKSMLHQLMTGQIRLLSDEGLPA